jgi:sterol desaturase/sphingolipid hydroxylase (fatty acid hydroxylase superfamily)
MHHSPSRIEILTSFYKHPIEILADSALSALLLYPFLGCSIAGAFWYNFFAATGEYFYHANVRTPRWLRFLIQTPELHSAHHELDVHTYNFGDIPLWDRLFGTYRDRIRAAMRLSGRRGTQTGFDAGVSRCLCLMAQAQSETESSVCKRPARGLIPREDSRR